MQRLLTIGGSSEHATEAWRGEGLHWGLTCKYDKGCLYLDLAWNLNPFIVACAYSPVRSPNIPVKKKLIYFFKNLVNGVLTSDIVRGCFPSVFACDNHTIIDTDKFCFAFIWQTIYD